MTDAQFLSSLGIAPTSIPEIHEAVFMGTIPPLELTPENAQQIAEAIEAEGLDPDTAVTSDDWMELYACEKERREYAEHDAAGWKQTAVRWVTLAEEQHAKAEQWKARALKAQRARKARP